MPRTHPPYPPEFRAEAVRLARGSDKSIPALAADLGVSSEALRHWLRQPPDGRHALPQRVVCPADLHPLHAFCVCEAVAWRRFRSGDRTW